MSLVDARVAARDASLDRSRAGVSHHPRRAAGKRVGVTGDFHVSAQWADARTRVLEPVGELDIATVPRLERHLDRELLRAGCGRLVLDTGGLCFVDACGLHGLLRARLRAEVLDRDLRLVVGSGSFARLLTVTGLEGSFVIHASVAEATTAV